MRRCIISGLLAACSLGALVGRASAEAVPFSCEMQADHQTVRIVVSNPAPRERSCLVNCQFQTPHYGGEVQIICARPIAAHANDVEMCTRRSGGQELLKQSFGSADCINF